MDRDAPGTLPQGSQRAGGMPELLAELQDTSSSQFVVAQVQAGELGGPGQPSSQRSAAGARQPAAPQPAGPRQMGTGGFTGADWGAEGGNPDPVPLPQRLQPAGVVPEPLAQQLHAGVTQPLAEGQIQLLQAGAGGQRGGQVLAAGAGEAGVPQPAGTRGTDPQSQPKAAGATIVFDPTMVTVPTMLTLLLRSSPWEGGTEG